MRNRGFEKVNKYMDIDFNLPKRLTKGSAGYDFESPVDVEINPGETKMVPTGVKVYMLEDEVLELYNRSSNGRKGIIIPNSVGIIDSDYYNNPDNEGEIAFLFKNTTDEVFYIKKGDRIGQGIFQKFLTVDNEEEITKTRTGGFGSTNKKGITLIALGITIIVLIIIISSTVSLVVYNMDQSRKNTYLSEVKIVQNTVLEYINTAKVENREISDSLKRFHVSESEISQYSEHLTSLIQDYYILSKEDLNLMNITNVDLNQQFLVNWTTGEVLNLNRVEYKGTTIKAGPVL